MTPTRQAEARAVPGWVAAVAVAGTVLIGIGAFWLSFTALADLAHHSGAGRGWVWPIIVDGVIVVATISVVALAPYGSRATRYPWILLFVCASVSVTANALHALISSHAGVPALLAAAVAAVPPLVLLAVTHLSVELTRRTRTAVDNVPPAPQPRPYRPPRVRAASPTVDRGRVTGRRARTEATRLHARGWTNRRIAAHLGVHPSTVGRWLATDDGPPATSGVAAVAAEGPAAAPPGQPRPSRDAERSRGRDGPTRERGEA